MIILITHQTFIRCVAVLRAFENGQNDGEVKAAE